MTELVSFKGIVFIVAALIAVVSSLLMVTRKNPIHSALWMIMTFFAMAVIYLILNAQFIAVAQVMVYAGAIMMLILFVIMLVHMEKGGEVDSGKPHRSVITRVAWALIAVVLLGEVIFGALYYQMTGVGGEYPVELVNRVGHVRTVGALLYSQYLFPFEIASILLLVGIVGAVVISKRK
jgi:NADH-quinone oxidoreductase subunit J